MLTASADLHAIRSNNGACELSSRYYGTSRRHMYADRVFLLVQHNLFRANDVLLIRHDIFCPEHVYGACKLSGRYNGAG